MSQPERMQVIRTMKEFKIRYILRALLTFNYNRTHTSNALGINTRTVRNIINNAKVVDGYINYAGERFLLSTIKPLKNPKKLRYVKMLYIAKVLKECAGIRQIASATLDISLRGIRVWINKMQKEGMPVECSRFHNDMSRQDSSFLKKELLIKVTHADKYKRRLEINKVK